MWWGRDAGEPAAAAARGAATRAPAGGRRPGRGPGAGMGGRDSQCRRGAHAPRLERAVPDGPERRHRGGGFRDRTGGRVPGRGQPLAFGGGAGPTARGPGCDGLGAATGSHGAGGRWAAAHGGAGEPPPVAGDQRMGVQCWGAARSRRLSIRGLCGALQQYRFDGLSRWHGPRPRDELGLRLSELPVHSGSTRCGEESGGRRRGGRRPNEHHATSRSPGPVHPT